MAGTILLQGVTGYRGKTRPWATPVTLAQAWADVEAGVALIGLVGVVAFLVLEARAIIRRARGTWRLGL
jgi:hypothetical protein